MGILYKAIFSYHSEELIPLLSKVKEMDNKARMYGIKKYWLILKLRGKLFFLITLHVFLPHLVIND